jgi:hypothetical protein
MANKIFRWIGSGNTGSTLPSIFSWNTSGNWEVLKNFGSGAAGGWRFTGTTYVPGPIDKAIIGNAKTVLSSNNTPLASNYVQTQVKSPCLFGGFIGNTAGGTWINAGLSGSASGTTYTTALHRFSVHNGGQPGMYFDGASGAYRTYNDTSTGLSTPLPLGGGLAPKDSCIDTIEWIERNYPLMGISASVDGSGIMQYSVPGYTSGWDDLTISARFIDIFQSGNSASSDINLKCVANYEPLTGNFAATGYTGPNAPVIKTQMHIYSPRDITINGGAFRFGAAYPLIKLDETGGRGFPIFSFDNMSVEDMQLSEYNETIIGSNVNFGALDIVDQMESGLVDNSGSPGIYTAYNKKLTSRKKVKILGSSKINTLFTTHYPGNTSNPNIEITGRIVLNRTSDINLGVELGNSLPNIPSELQHIFYDTAINSMQDWDNLSARTYLSQYYPTDGQYMATENIAPGAALIEIGDPAVTSQKLEDIRLEHYFGHPIYVRFVGNTTVDKIDLHGINSRLDFWNHSGTVQIGTVNTANKATIDTRKANIGNSKVYFGTVSSSGVCGGIQEDLYWNGPNYGGSLLVDQGSRFFNVATGKRGLLQTSLSASGAESVSEGLAPVISGKS